MQTQRFVRRPFYVDAVQVTQENMEAVRKWSNGKIRQTSQEPKASYIYIHVRVPMTKKQTQAFVGDWVLRSVSGDGIVSFKIYGDIAFNKAFVNTALTPIRIIDNRVPVPAYAHADGLPCTDECQTTDNCS
jgi:hypothetical protein